MSEGLNNRQMRWTVFSLVFWVVLGIPAIFMYFQYKELIHDAIGFKQSAIMMSSKIMMQDKPVHKPRYVFVDLGANTGDSCRMFLQDPQADVKFNFPTPLGMNHSDAEIYLFEANPNFNVELVQLKQELLHRNIKTHIFPSTPVWVEQKVMPFFIDATNHHAPGSSIDPSHPDPVRTGGKTYNLTTISIAHFLLENFLPEDFVIVKMDIELAEYTIVPHMADMNVGVVMDYLFVEWHNWLIDGNDPRVAKSNEAVEELKNAGTQFPAYNTFTR